MTSTIAPLLAAVMTPVPKLSKNALYTSTVSAEYSDGRYRSASMAQRFQYSVEPSIFRVPTVKGNMAWDSPTLLSVPKYDANVASGSLLNS